LSLQVCQITLKIELILLINVNLGCIDSHARFYITRHGTAEREKERKRERERERERERVCSLLLYFFPRDLYGTARSCIELSQSRSRSLFHEYILEVDFHEHFPQITPVSISIERWREYMRDKLYSTNVRNNQRFVPERKCSYANHLESSPLIYAKYSTLPWQT